MLKPTWEKPYYRCAESLCKLGDLERALTINNLGRSLCEKLDELERQYAELLHLNKCVGNTSYQILSSMCYGMSLFYFRHSGASDIDASMEIPSIEMETNSYAPNKSMVEPKEQRNAGASLQKINSKSVHSKEIRSVVNDTSNPTKDEPFTNFELLQYPFLDKKISCYQLRQLCNHVKLRNCSPASYLTQGSAWESLEPTYYQPSLPKTDPTSIHKPMSAVFDEIWCPVIADVEDSDLIIPPTFTYLDNGAVKQTLPTLVTGAIRKDRLRRRY